MADDDSVDGTRMQRDAGDDPVRARVDTEDRRVDRRAVPRENAFGRYPDGAGAERDSDGGQRQWNPRNGPVRRRIDSPERRLRQVRWLPLHVAIAAVDRPHGSGVGGEPRWKAGDADPPDDVPRDAVDSDDAIVSRIAGPDGV